MWLRPNTSAPPTLPPFSVNAEELRAWAAARRVAEPEPAAAEPVPKPKRKRAPSVETYA